MYTLQWSEKTCKHYFKKWFDTTFNISAVNTETSHVICRPDYIIAFFSFDPTTALFLVRTFADQNPRNDGLF